MANIYNLILITLTVIPTLTAKPREPCVIPDPTLSNLHQKIQCSTNHLIAHNSQCLFTCGTQEFLLRCHNGRYYQNQEQPININYLCAGNPSTINHHSQLRFPTARNRPKVDRLLQVALRRERLLFVLPL